MGSTTNGDHTDRHDAVIIGAGFSGIAMLYRLRKLGLRAKILESGEDFGGVWHWNRYPGARVDSEWPFYQLSIPEVYEHWTWSERFPDSEELRRYFAHIDQVLGLRKDVIFQAHVNNVRWDGNQLWTTTTQQGHRLQSKYLILCTGLLHQALTPDFPGIDRYQGDLYHTAHYPEHTDLRGKNVAVIGAGATAVQVVQQLAKEAQHLTVFMRRPSICLPMKQRPLGECEQTAFKSYFEMLFREGRKSMAGFPGRTCSQAAISHTPAERDRFFETLWERGAFNFTMFNYDDILQNKESNRLVYEFWVKKTAARMKDERKRNLMVPQKPPYYFGTKRCPLEQDYYEMLDRENVDIVNLNEDPIQTFSETGIMTSKEIGFDAIVLATGFDSFSGSLFKMGLKSKDGTDIRHVWEKGIRTHLGMTFHGFPNTFMVYTPHG